MTYYTPPELRREMDRFGVVLSNPPFNVSSPTAPGKTLPARGLIEMLRRTWQRIVAGNGGQPCTEPRK